MFTQLSICLPARSSSLDIRLGTHPVCSSKALAQSSASFSISSASCRISTGPVASSAGKRMPHAPGVHRHDERCGNRLRVTYLASSARNPASTILIEVKLYSMLLCASQNGKNCGSSPGITSPDLQLTYRWTGPKSWPVVPGQLRQCYPADSFKRKVIQHAPTRLCLRQGSAAESVALLVSYSLLPRHSEPEAVGVYASALPFMPPLLGIKVAPRQSEVLAARDDKTHHHTFRQHIRYTSSQCNRRTSDQVQSLCDRSVAQQGDQRGTFPGMDPVQTVGMVLFLMDHSSAVNGSCGVILRIWFVVPTRLFASDHVMMLSLLFQPNSKVHAASDMGFFKNSAVLYPEQLLGQIEPASLKAVRKLIPSVSACQT